jgi:hypothetical protein
MLSFQSTFILIPIGIRRLRNAKQLNIWNETKLDGIHETKPGKIYETKPGKIYETKRNFTIGETKRNEISLFFGFAKQAKFRETVFLFRIVSCFAKHKKRSEMETLATIVEVFIPSM